MANNYERIVWGGGITKKFEFYYGYNYAGEEMIPVRKNKPYKIVYTKDKEELYFDLKNNQIVRYKNLTLFARYKKAKKLLERETYLRPYKVIVTNKMREKGLVSQRRRGTKRFLKTKEGTFVSPQLYFQGMKGSTASNKMIEFRTKFNNLVNEFAIENPSK